MYHGYLWSTVPTDEYWCQLYVSVSTCIYCLSQTEHLSLWIGAVFCLTDESFPLSGDCLQGGTNFCTCRHKQWCVAPWWETGPHHLIDWHANTRGQLWTPQTQEHEDRGLSAPCLTYRQHLDTRNKSLHINSSSSSVPLYLTMRLADIHV